jgi:hypothetical protein
MFGLRGGGGGGGHGTSPLLALTDDVLQLVLHWSLASSLSAAHALCLVTSSLSKMASPMIAAIRPVQLDCLQQVWLQPQSTDCSAYAHSAPHTALPQAAPYFVVSKKWWNAWASGLGASGPIANEDLLETASALSASTQVRDGVDSSQVVVLTPHSWEALVACCGGGPPLKRIARLRPSSQTPSLELRHLALHIFLNIGRRPQLKPDGGVARRR